MRDVHLANQVVIRGVGIDTGLGAATNLVVTFARIGAIALGGVLVLRGQITLGTLVAFLGYVGGLFGPVQGLTGIYQTIQRADVSLDEVFSILDVQDTLGDAPDAIELEAVRGEVVFDHVRFNYERRDRPVLDGLDLVVKPGETVAIVGPSGSGKTTAIKMVNRLIAPTSGEVLVEGKPTAGWDPIRLRRRIGYRL